MEMTRLRAGSSVASAFSSVVLPDPVPPGDQQVAVVPDTAAACSTSS